MKAPSLCCCCRPTHCPVEFLTQLREAGVCSAVSPHVLPFLTLPALASIGLAAVLSLTMCFWESKVAVDPAVDDRTWSPVSQWCCALEKGLWVLVEDVGDKERLWYVELKLASPFLSDRIPWPCKAMANSLGSQVLHPVSFCLHKSGFIDYLIIHCGMGASQNLSREIVYRKTR